jgi:hypothetical protein
MAAAKKTATKKPAAKKAAAPKVVEEVEETTTDEVTFGVKDLCELVKEETGTEVSTREMRTLLRKMARDSRIDRKIIPGNRARYDWAGPEDPEVQAALEAFKSGELEEDKKAKLAELKERKEAQKAAKKAAEAEEADDEELEDDEA